MELRVVDPPDARRAATTGSGAVIPPLFALARFVLI
jgi:hypothetical protein